MKRVCEKAARVRCCLVDTRQKQPLGFRQEHRPVPVRDCFLCVNNIPRQDSDCNCFLSFGNGYDPKNYLKFREALYLPVIPVLIEFVVPLPPHLQQLRSKEVRFFFMLAPEFMRSL